VYPKVTGTVSLGLISAFLVAEFWRSHSRPAPAPLQDVKLNIPTKKANLSAGVRWEAPIGDDPITSWADDIVGRTAIVELLADHALRLRTPVVALHGGLGDGKSSVLNLLRNAVEGQAIVVSFSAWLPGSETTLAADLFKDIATECRKLVNVPQLRKRALAFARTVSGSVSYLGGLKELIPAQSQRDEILELHDALWRVPMPILVLLDEIDRMQGDELVVLLKILRGVSSFPNVTFVCAFSEEEIRKEIQKQTRFSYDYLEKFFPVSVNLSPPPVEMIGKCLRIQLKQRLSEQRWFRTDEDCNKFDLLLEDVWTDTLQNICTNLRKAGLLVNDVAAAGRPIAGEVNALDLVLIEAIRRFCPSVYWVVRSGAEYLTDARNNQFFSEEKDTQAFITKLNGAIDPLPESGAVRAILCLLFPKYATTRDRMASIVSNSRRRNNENSVHDEKRICNADYFQIYFRAAVPEELFSNSELERVLADISEANTEEGVRIAFKTGLDSIPTQHPKRGDFLWKLSRASERLSATEAERLAYAAAAHASDYRYDRMNVGEAAYALNIVFIAAQKVSTSHPQRVLEGAMACASDDTFAVRILEYTEDRTRNKILTDFSNIEVAAIKRVFVERMRKRYADSDIKTVNITHGDWYAFRRWVENSDDDRKIEQEFWRKYIGFSRKRLAQAIKFIYPGDGFWSEDPTPLVDGLFPLSEITRLLNELIEVEELDDGEAKGLARMKDLMEGKYPRSP
jgi:hypothetical protein